MANLNEYLQQKLDLTEAKGRLRTLHQAIAAKEETVPSIVSADGKTLVNFSSNDYLGLSRHPEVIKSACKATKDYGTGARSSRLIAGHSPDLTTLEKDIANYRGTESALVFSSGYAANVGTIAALMDQNDLIIADKLSHACLLDGARLSGAELHRFGHNNTDHLKNLLALKRDEFANCLIITESIFSMDGDIAPLEEILWLAKRNNCWLMVDDAHGAGFTNKLLAPIASDENGIISGTLSKALGSLGGYVSGSDTLTQYLVNHARSFMFSTALPPSCIASAHQALRIVNNQPELADKALEHAKLFTSLMGLTEAQSPIVPYIIGESDAAIEATKVLYDKGFYLQAIRPPTVPPGTARLRITFTAEHSEENIRSLADSIKELGIQHA